MCSPTTKRLYCWRFCSIFYFCERTTKRSITFNIVAAFKKWFQFSQFFQMFVLIKFFFAEKSIVCVRTDKARIAVNWNWFLKITATDLRPQNVWHLNLVEFSRIFVFISWIQKMASSREKKKPKQIIDTNCVLVWAESNLDEILWRFDWLKQKNSPSCVKDVYKKTVHDAGAWIWLHLLLRLIFYK